MNLLEIKTAVAAYFTMPQGQVVGVSDLTVNGIDLFLVAANQAKQTASQAHDFGFQRQLLSLSLNTATGAQLSTAVVFGTTTAVVVKTVLDVGILDSHGNLCPVEWTTAEESQERQREENRRSFWRYPTDAQYHSWQWGESRITFRGDTVMLWPLCFNSVTTLTLGIDAYVDDADWTAANLTTPVTDIWTTKGAQYIMWQCICDLNNYFKSFVPRQEGNVAVPQERAATAMQAFIDWDVFKYEEARRHGR